MIGLINKFLSKDENLSLFYPVFQRLKKNTEVEKIFKSISEFSEKSEVRYVGGCVRKIINQEEVDDIDLATNIEPTKVIEIFKKDNINIYVLLCDITHNNEYFDNININENIDLIVKKIENDLIFNKINEYNFYLK